MFDMPMPSRARFRANVVQELLRIGERTGLPAKPLEAWARLPEVRRQIDFFHGGPRPAETVAVLLSHDFVSEMNAPDFWTRLKGTERP